MFGLLVAWVLTRDDFPGKRLVDAVIDLPFALPTIVASLVMLALYGPNSPVGLHLQHTKWGVGIALLFVTLPFVVRSVQPVLLELDQEVEQAAASLGASNPIIFTKVILPALLPSLLSGAGLAFSRAIGEFGSVVLIGGAVPGRDRGVLAVDPHLDRERRPHRRRRDFDCAAGDLVRRAVHPARRRIPRRAA